MKLIRKILNFFGNAVWFIAVGFVLGLTWLILGALWCVTIIGIPFGVQCFKFAGLSFFPYGKHVHLDPKKHPVANVIWAVLFGWEMAIVYTVISIFYFLTVIGIPKGIIALKLAKLAFLPFGAKVDTKK